MIEKLGMRTAEFVGSTARRMAGAAEQLVTDQRKPKHRFAKIALPVLTAGAAAAAAAASGRSTTKDRSTTKGRSTSSNNSSTSGVAKQAKHEVTTKAKSAAEKTRDELYELAKKADIPGRSGMSKDELAKALGK